MYPPCTEPTELVLPDNHAKFILGIFAHDSGSIVNVVLAQKEGHISVQSEMSVEEEESSSFAIPKL